MKLWKMSIKTGATKGFHPLQWCRDHKIVGVGWSKAYVGVTQVPADPLIWLAAHAKRGVSPVRMVVQRMNRDDLVWLHQDGSFFLCKIVDDSYLAGPQIGADYGEHDIGHARRVEWVTVPEDLVPGRVQRAVISRRMVCRISSGPRLAHYCEFLHTQLHADPNWRPVVDLTIVRAVLKSLGAAELPEVVSPDDWEDIVAGYLQMQGWILIKSSCFPSKPRFEFRMIREESGRTKTAYLQVKSGKKEPLPPASYAHDVTPDAVVYLFSTCNGNPYPGPPVNGVIPLAYPAIHAWMVEHVALLPVSLCTQLCLLPANRTLGLA